MMSNDNKELPKNGDAEETAINGESEQQGNSSSTTDVNNSTHILMSLQNAEYDEQQDGDDSNSDDEFVEAEDSSSESSVESKEVANTEEDTPIEKNDERDISSEKNEQSIVTNKTSNNASNIGDSSKQSDKSLSNTPPTDTRRRVKLYMLNQNRTWDDRGTGHVTSTYLEHLEGNSLLVKAESDGSILLESKILPDTAYQKQQDTLIVWSEGENYDLALSFQERIGCEEIWAKICYVQGKDPSLDVTQDMIEDEESDLPPCEIERLDEINSVIHSCLTLQGKKENISMAIESESYIPKLLELFTELESKKDIVSLQKLFDVIKNIFLLNQNSLLEILVSEECIWDVFGVLEYDPNGAAVKDDDTKILSGKSASSTKNVKKDNSESTSVPSETDFLKLFREKRHREFLTNYSRFKEIIPLEKKDLVNKIHQTYRLQYIQDVILPSPSVFEDNMLSTLSSFIFFNKVEIVNLIQQDRKFLQEILRQLADETESFNEKRRDLVLFLKELWTFSHTLQLQNRDTFIKSLQHMGLLDTVQLLLNAKDPVIKNGGVDMLNHCVDYSPSMIREFCINQTNLRTKSTVCPNRTLEIDLKFPDLSREQVDNFLINVMIKQMILDTDPDMGMTTQLAHTLKILLDPENMLNNDSFNVRHLQSSRYDYHNFFSQKSEKMDFLNFFYKYCLGRLVEPLEQITTIKLKPEQSSNNKTDEMLRKRLTIEQTSQSAQLLATILDLFTFCVEHHGLHIRNFILTNGILKTSVKLLASRHTFLVLAVIRFIRRVVNLKDEFYNKRIVSANIFAPIFDVFLKNGGRYNLLDSAVIDLFEFVKLTNNNLLVNYIIDNFWKDKLENIEYIKTFKSMKLSYNQNNKLREKIELNNILLSTRFRRDRRDLDKEEEKWFRDEDEDDDDSIEDEDEPLDIYVPDEKAAPPSLRLASRIKRQKTEKDQTSDSSISSIFTSTFKTKPEDRKLKINITSKTLGNPEVKCELLNESAVRLKSELDCSTNEEILPKSNSSSISTESETESKMDVDSSTFIEKKTIEDSVTKTCVDSTINESQTVIDKNRLEKNHVANANTSSKAADSTAKENGSSTIPDEILEFVSSSTYTPQSETTSNLIHSDITKKNESITLKKNEVSSSSSMTNKRKFHEHNEDHEGNGNEDDEDGNDIQGIESSLPISTSDSNQTRQDSRSKRLCLSNLSNNQSFNEPGLDEEHEANISQSN